MSYEVLTVRPSNLEEMVQRFGNKTREMQTIAARGWHGGEDFPLGYLLVEETGQSVGQLLCLYTRRSFEGGTWLSANMSTWFVAPEHRGAGLKLMYAMHGDIDHHGAIATILAPGGKAQRIYLAFRYKPLGRERFTVQTSGAATDAARINASFEALAPEDTPLRHEGLVQRFSAPDSTLFLRADDTDTGCSVTVFGVDAESRNTPAVITALESLREQLSGQDVQISLESTMVLGRLTGEPLASAGWTATQTRLDRLYRGTPAPDGALDFLYTEALLFGSKML